MRRNVPEYARCINSSSDFLMNELAGMDVGSPELLDEPACLFVNRLAPACRGIC